MLVKDSKLPLADIQFIHSLGVSSYEDDFVKHLDDNCTFGDIVKSLGAPVDKEELKIIVDAVWQVMKRRGSILDKAAVISKGMEVNGDNLVTNSNGDGIMVAMK